MALEPGAAPGRWTNPDWNGTAGTFAVVIGVSAYKHLKNGPEQAGNTYGLEQLDVSALTAFHFFRWLRDKYQYDDAPLAKVWLLLSPTAKETPLLDAGANAAPVPTFDNCRAAIGEWYQAMAGLDPESCKKSRPMFFFSGHGIEVMRDRQVLLPADYLAPPLPLVNRAISTANLTSGLCTLAMLEHFFFLDACRNDHPDLRGSDLTGQDVLNSTLSHSSPPGFLAPVVCATGAGSPAWAPKDPKDGISLFGQALLEALEARKGFKPKCTKERCAVNTFPLTEYANDRVSELLKAQGARFIQPVQMRGAVGNCTVAYLPPKPKTRGPRAAAAPAPPRAGDDLQPVPLPTPTWTPSTAASVEEVHDVLGSEYLTAMWLSARAFNLRTREWVPNNEAVSIRDVHRSQDATAHRMTLEMQTNDAHWFEVRDGSTAIACTLPGDRYMQPRYIVEFTRVRGQGITDFEARLSPESPDVLGLAATLWEKYRAFDIAGATNEDDIKQLEQALFGKMQSPLAATIAGVMLLRARRYELLRDWLRNLAEKFPERPDGPVLWEEHMLRTDVERTVPGNVFDTVLELTTRGLPHTAEAFGYAVRQVGELLQFAKPEPAVRQRLEALQERLTKAMRFFRDTGLCSVFIGPSEVVKPQLVLPT